jgi:hypothetical protein
VRADWKGWNAALVGQANARSTRQRLSSAASLPVREDESRDKLGNNDSTATAELIEGFGSDEGLSSRATVSGAMAMAPFAKPERLNSKRDSTYRRPISTGIPGKRKAVTTVGRISKPTQKFSDIDHYTMNLKEGQVVDIQLEPLKNNFTPYFFG